VRLTQIHRCSFITCLAAVLVLSGSAAVIAVLLLLNLAIPHALRSRRFQICGSIVRRVRTRRRIVALTFDDGPYDSATWIDVLDELRRRSVRATFFVVGHQAEHRLGLLRLALADGHELGNHTYSHRPMLFRSQRAIQCELDITDSLIRAAGSDPLIHFRPPYCAKGIALPRYLAGHDRLTILWDIEPEGRSGAPRSPGEIGRRVLARVRPGSIVLLHAMGPSNANTRQALPDILDGLHSCGFELVTISELIAARTQSPASRSAARTL
jgi:peptidoglycan/xylan/chitin deacetylase (PgdA/CDA1 family)